MDIETDEQRILRIKTAKFINDCDFAVRMLNCDLAHKQNARKSFIKLKKSEKQKDCILRRLALKDYLMYCNELKQDIVGSKNLITQFIKEGENFQLICSSSAAKIVMNLFHKFNLYIKENIDNI